MKAENLIKLLELISDNKSEKTDKSFDDKDFIGKDFIGKYAIVRTRNEGVNAGKVVDLDETGIILEDARRLYYHCPQNKNYSWYEGVAIDGLSSDSKVGAVAKKLIVEDYSLTLCSEKAELSIRSAPAHKQEE